MSSLYLGSQLVDKELWVISELFSWLTTRTATQKRFSNHLINKWTTGKPTAKVLMEHGHRTAVCVLRWLFGWGLTALLTQNRSYRACKFVSCVIIKLGDVTALTKQVKRTWHWQCLTVSGKSQHVFIFCKKAQYRRSTSTPCPRKNYFFQ